MAGWGCGNLFAGGPELTRSEQKLRESELAPSAADMDSGAWGEGFTEHDGYPAGAADGGGRAVGGNKPAAQGGMNGPVRNGFGLAAPAGEGDKVTGDNEATVEGSPVPHGVNQSLARLEMNSLEVKLFLDSIDQRISRMEPRLEGMRGVEQEAVRGAGGAEGRSAEDLAPAAQEQLATVEESPAPAEETPISATSERRRRAQGVPVERRRAPHTVPVEVDEAEPWALEWKPWAAQWKPWLQKNRVWVPAAVFAIVAALGLLFWRVGRDPRTGGQAVAPELSAPVAGAVAGGERKSSAEVPWAAAASSRPERGGRPGLNGQSVDARSAGRTRVEQGVAAALPGGTPAAATRLSAPSNGNAETSSNATGNGSSSPGGLEGSAAPIAASAQNGSTSTQTGSTSAQTGSMSAQTGSTNDAGGSDTALAESGPSRSGPSGRIIPPSVNRVHVSSGVMAGSLIYSRPPTYPKGFARLFHTQGRVVMQAIISKNGRVENLRVISGHYMLRGAAKDAVRSWRYRPYHVNGSPVEVATIVSVEFQR